jgi:lysophospholipase L1-like esterase
MPPPVRRAIAACMLAALLAACSDGSGGSAAADGWVGTWSSSSVCLRAAGFLGLPDTTRFADQSIRMIVHTSIGGERVRVRLTNRCGDAPLEIGAATIAIHDAGAGIRPESARALSFAGAPSVAIAAGATVTSDPADLDLPALGDLAITIYLPDETVPSTSHPQAARGYVSGAGDFTASVDGAPFQTVTPHWFFLDAVDVAPRGDAAAIVAFGDSVTEGTGTTFSANRRWPDFLARRLADAGLPFGVLNQGINGNKVLNSLLGDSALLRFDRDALDQTAVKYVIVLEGINDIGLGNPDVTAQQIIDGYRELIDRAHARGIAIFGATLTPAKDNPYSFYEPYDEAKRVAVNQFIRDGGAFDAVFDFAAAVTDPSDPAHWRPGLSPDALHPSDAGAELLAGTIDLALFR